MDETDSNTAVLADRNLHRFLSLISADSLDSIFQELAWRTSEWTPAPRCALWWLDTNRAGFRLAAAAGEWAKPADADDLLPYEEAEGLGLLAAEEPAELPAVCALRPSGFGLASGLAARIHYEDRTSGLLVVSHGDAPGPWADSARRRLRALALHGAVLCRNFEQRERQTRLVEFLQEMSEATSEHTLYDLVLREVKPLLGCDRAVIRRVNLQSGHLDYVRSSPRVADGFPLNPGEGVTGRALHERHTYRIADVAAPEWAPIYRQLWSTLPPARAELAVPILLKKARVRIGTRFHFVDKPFGVLNLESPTKGAFSRLDESSAGSIAQRMAPVMERIEFDKKLDRLRQAAQTLATKREWDSIVKVLLEGIRDALGYEFVSLSIIEDSSRIRCMRVIGIPEADEFRKRAVHDLDSEHVQARVVRYRRAEVPPPDEPSLNEIRRRFGLDRLIRVFVPMIEHSRNEVVGTISAGYDRTYREHIYQRDIQLLKVLVAFGTNAMETWRRGTIDRVSHEINAPLTAVRANLSTLLRRRKNKTLTDDQLDLALEDMETDTEVLYYQMQQLEYVLGGSVAEATRQPLRVKPVLLFRDIIFKTINQLKPLVIERGLDPKKIEYEDVHKVKEVNVDKSKVSQVIFNLFMNAVKYADSPESFEIRIGAAERRDHYVIKFCDWGIGIPKGLEEKIFHERFRAPEARDRNVMGSGLGLTISRQLMREHGGDLVLKNRRGPTEFHLLIPKHVREGS
jgi:signal transduction histidine kinase/GAF domain-containing protein